MGGRIRHRRRRNRRDGRGTRFEYRERQRGGLGSRQLLLLCRVEAGAATVAVIPQARMVCCWGIDVRISSRPGRPGWETDLRLGRSRAALAVERDFDQ
jgi:hypothetical protein